MKKNFIDLLTEIEKITANDDRFDLLEKRSEMLVKKHFGSKSEYLKEIQNITYHPLIFTSNSDDRMFNESFNEGLKQLKNTIRVIIEEIEISEPKHSNNFNLFNMEIFISHSSKDKIIAKALIDVLKHSLQLTNEKIRCTSVDGYRLPAGASTNEHLKKEIFDAKIFIGLITPDSLQSTYVLFELGARWGTNQNLIPIVVNETDKKLLKDPLAGLNVLSLSEQGQLYQLIEDVALNMDIKPQPVSAYIEYVTNLLTQIKTY